jgi:hypothetical protein
VGARVLDPRRRLLGERLDSLLALREKVEQLDAHRARNSVSDPRELGVEGVFEFAVGHVVPCATIR